MVETITKLDISALTNRYVEAGIVDPHDMSAMALEELSEEELREITERYLSRIFREAIMKRRHAARTRSRSSRWDSAQAAHSILLQPEYIDGTWKSLGQLTTADLTVSIAAYEALSQQNKDEADRRRKLVRKMNREKAKHVADLDPEEVVKILEA